MQTPDTFRNSPMHNKSAILELMDELKPDQMMELVDYLKKSSNNQHLLIVHHESGDEIHFTVLDYSLYSHIDKMVNDGLDTQEQVEDMLNLIYSNSLERLFCQTYAAEDYANIKKYNIVKCIHLPELGC